MGLARKLLALTSLIAIASYVLHTPVPDGYSTSATLQIRVLHASVKIFGMMSSVGQLMGFGPKMILQRSMLNALVRPDIKDQDSTVHTHDAVFDGIPVRVYVPAERTKEILPAVIYIHGGGWVLFSIDFCDPLVRLLCKMTNAVFISVEYRLAPEWPFPAAHDDCVTATKYLLRHAAEYNIDPKRVAIGGDSAGGNLAATVSLKLRDENFEPKVKLQVLIYPCVQIVDFQLPSMISNAHGPVLTKHGVAEFAAAYIGNSTLAGTFATNEHISPIVRQRISSNFLNLARLPEKYLAGYDRNVLDYGSDDQGVWNEVKDLILGPYLSPLLAPDLKGLPEAYVLTCEYDVLRDEGILYAFRLREAGNDVTHFNYDIGFHAILTTGLDWPEARPVFESIAEFIVKRL